MATKFKIFISDVGTTAFPQDIEGRVNEWLEQHGDNIDLLTWDWQVKGAYCTMVLHYEDVQRPERTGFHLPSNLLY